MSLKAELEQWASAIKLYDDQEYDKAIQAFVPIADRSKILFNMGLIYATMGLHDDAVEHFNNACQLDRHLAISYFQCGVSNFVIQQYDRAYRDFDEALSYMRENDWIDYTQLGLKFKLWTAEILFNRGLTLIYMGQEAAGMQDLSLAQRSKQTNEHSVIDEAIRDRGEGYNVFSIPPGILFRPAEGKVKNSKPKDFMGKATLRAAASAQDAFTDFTGVTRLKQGLTPSGAPLSRSATLSSNSTVTLVDLEKPKVETKEDFGGDVKPLTGLRGRSQTTGPVIGSRPAPLESGATLAKNASTGTPRPPRPMGNDRMNAPLPPISSQDEDRGRGPYNPGRQSPPNQRNGPVRPAPNARSRSRGPPAAPAAPSAWRAPPPGRASPSGRGYPPPEPTRQSEVSDLLDGYMGYQDEPYDESFSAGVDVRQWANRTMPGPPPSGALSRAPSAVAMRRQPSVSNGGRSRKNTVYDDDERMSRDYEDLVFDLIKIRVKLHYKSDVRGMAISPDSTFDAFRGMISKKFNVDAKKMTMKFADDDGGLVSLMDEMDFEMAVDTARASANGRPEGKLEVWLQ